MPDVGPSLTGAAQAGATRSASRTARSGGGASRPRDRWPGRGLAVLILAAVGWLRWGPPVDRPVSPKALVRQWDARTCGPASVATLLNACGRSWTRAGLTRECNVRACGCSMEDLWTCLRANGIAAQAWQAAGPPALERVPRPFIAHLSAGHFVVVAGGSGRQLWVFDPGEGVTEAWTADDLYRRGAGWVLAVGR